LRLSSIQSSFFICGDLNARHASWGCARANQAGNCLFECGGPFAIHYSSSHTRIPLNNRQSPSTLDIVLTNGLHDLNNIQASNELSSDHLPVTFEVTTDTQRVTPDYYIYDYRETDWNRFRHFLDSRVNLDFSLDLVTN